MKKIEDFGFNKFSHAQLKEQEMKAIKGGDDTFLQIVIAAWAVTPSGTVSIWKRCNEGDNTSWCGDIYDFVISNGYVEVMDQIGWGKVWETFDGWMGYIAINGYFPWY